MRPFWSGELLHLTIGLSSGLLDFLFRPVWSRLLNSDLWFVYMEKIVVCDACRGVGAHSEGDVHSKGVWEGNVPCDCEGSLKGDIRI
jgi:hypothetical protein